MSQPLSPCPACQRHVFADACECPFCAAKLSPDRCARAQVLPPGYYRMSRAARLAAGAALIGATACGYATEYGSPPIDDRDASADSADARSEGAGGSTGTGGQGGGGPAGGRQGSGGAGGSSHAGGAPGAVPLYGSAAPVPEKPAGES